jgi:orotidine-5'-phosphate decarboxylase
MLKDEMLRLQSYLCVGLDTDITRLPAGLPATPEGMLAFNKKIIEATADFAVSYKINTAFYEAQGAEGWQVMAETLKAIPAQKFTIADAKRGDIGNTVAQYAKAFFEQMDFDAITVAPYMGADSVTPFLAYPHKTVILLALTSNESAQNFQTLSVGEDMLYEKVLQTSQTWASPAQLMYVVGATKAAHLQKIRQIVPNHFLLVPGVGAQGGSLEEVAKFGMNKDIGILVNASRSILYASAGEDFAEQARKEAQAMQQAMAKTLENRTIL